MVNRFRSETEIALLDETKKTSGNKNIEAMPIHADELKQSWAAIKDIHESGKLIKKYGNRRNEVYEALGEEYAIPLELNSIEQVLELASKQSTELMIFAMNHAAVQVYSGKITKLLRTGPWFNILDPSFNLHLRTEGISNIWLVKKPSQYGPITSIDVLDKNGIEFLLITGNKALKQAESKEWQDIYNSALIKERVS